MEHNKKTKFSVTELSLENFDLAREELKKKGEMHLINFLNLCVCGDIKDANEFKKLFIQVEDCIEFIDSVIERTKFPGNKRVKM